MVDLYPCVFFCPRFQLQSDEIRHFFNYFFSSLVYLPRTNQNENPSLELFSVSERILIEQQSGLCGTIYC